MAGPDRGCALLELRNTRSDALLVGPSQLGSLLLGLVLGGMPLCPPEFGCPSAHFPLAETMPPAPLPLLRGGCPCLFSRCCFAC